MRKLVVWLICILFLSGCSYKLTNYTNWNGLNKSSDLNQNLNTWGNKTLTWNNNLNHSLQKKNSVSWDLDTDTEEALKLIDDLLK